MKVVARAKVTQDRVYSAAYHPDPTMDLIFFGGGCVRAQIFLSLSLFFDSLGYGRLADDAYLRR
jgi:hypothetical protein